MSVFDCRFSFPARSVAAEAGMWTWIWPCADGMMLARYVAPEPEKKLTEPPLTEMSPAEAQERLREMEPGRRDAERVRNWLRNHT